MDTTSVRPGDKPVHLTEHDTHQVVTAAARPREVWTTSRIATEAHDDTGTVATWGVSFHTDPEYDEESGHTGVDHETFVRAMREAVAEPDACAFPADAVAAVAAVLDAGTRGAARAALHRLPTATVDMLTQVAALGRVAVVPEPLDVGPWTVPMVAAEALGLIRGGPIMHAALPEGEVLLRGPRPVGQVPTPAELSAMEKETPVLRLGTAELLDVAEGGTVAVTVAHGRRRGDTAVVRLATVDELLELHRLAGAHLAETMADRAPGWEMPPPLTLAKAAELTSPVTVTADERRQLVTAFPTTAGPDQAELRHLYPYVWARGAELGSSEHWRWAESRRAYDDGAPADVVHRDEWDDIATHGRQDKALRAAEQGDAVILRHPDGRPYRVWWRAGSLTEPTTAARLARYAANIRAGRPAFTDAGD